MGMAAISLSSAVSKLSIWGSGDCSAASAVVLEIVGPLPRLLGDTSLVLTTVSAGVEKPGAGQFHARMEGAAPPSAAFLVVSLGGSGPGH